MTTPLTREEFGAAMKIVMESGGTWPRENLLAVQRAAEQIIAHDAALRARLAEAEAARFELRVLAGKVLDDFDAWAEAVNGMMREPMNQDANWPALRKLRAAVFAPERPA